MHRGADAVIVKVARGFGHDLGVEQWDERTGSPPMFVESELHHVRLAGDVGVEQRDRGRPGIDQGGAGSASVAARCRHDASCGKDPRADDLARPFPRSKAEDEVGVVPGVVDGGEPAVQVSVQRAKPDGRRLSGAIEVDVHVDQPRDQELATTINPRRLARSINPTAGDAGDPVAFDEHRGAGDRRAAGSINDGDVVNEHRRARLCRQRGRGERQGKRDGARRARPTGVSHWSRPGRG